MDHPSRIEYEKLSAPFKVVMFVPDLETAKQIRDWYESPEGRTAWMAHIQEREIKRVQCWIAHGLHPVYDSFEDAMCDYFPDFSWKAEDFKEDMRTILSNQQWQILAGRLKEVRGFDLMAEMQVVLDEVDD